MKALILAVVTVPLAWLIALVVSIPLTLLEAWIEWEEKRKLRKWYDVRIKVYKRLAMEETNPIEKGYKVARLCNYAYERSMLSWRKK